MSESKIELTDAEYFGMAFIYVHKDTGKVRVLNADVAKAWHKTPDADKWNATATINTHMFIESILNDGKGSREKAIKKLLGK